jgi:hypothetical protein
MGRSGTQIVYDRNRKRLLQDERRHEENSVKDIENFNKVVETLIKKNPVYKLLDPRKHLLKQYKDPLDFLTEDRRKRKSSMNFFFAMPKLQIFLSRALHQKRSSRYLKPKAKKKIWSGSFLSCNQKSEKKKKEEIISQLGAHIQKNGSAWKSTLEEEWVFLNNYCFKGTPRLLKISRMYSSMKKLVKSSRRTNESSTFSVSMSSATS